MTLAIGILRLHFRPLFADENFAQDDSARPSQLPKAKSQTPKAKSQEPKAPLIISPMLPHRLKSADAELAYWTLGDGHPVVLLHPFPANHEFWLPVADALSTRYRLILPDLRGHGESEVGEGPATMEKHAADVGRVLDDANVGRASLIGVSIGGYVIFEFWRKHRGRAAALSLCNTRAPADGPEARAGRLQAANDVLDRGTEPFFQSMIPKLMGKTTREMRPDLVDGAVRMMRQMSPEDVAQVQRGMAARPTPSIH